MKLKEEIEKATDFEISYEGEYKWIAFLPSKGEGNQCLAYRTGILDLTKTEQ
jgi:hypothetical protein